MTDATVNLAVTDVAPHEMIGQKGSGSGAASLHAEASSASSIDSVSTKMLDAVSVAVSAER